jgi:hypothetical protein
VIARGALCVAGRGTGTFREADLVVIHALCGPIGERVARAYEVRQRAWGA